MKKLLIAVIVLALLAAGLSGYLLYQTTHIFVEDTAYSKGAQELDLRGQEISVQHYNSLKSQLPECSILWDVPFQGFQVANNSTVLLMRGVTEEDIKLLPYFTELEEVDVTDCKDYVTLEKLESMLPGVEMHYLVDVGGSEISRSTNAVALNPGEYDYEMLMENLKYLPKLAEITFAQTELTSEKFSALEEAYPEISFDYTVDLLGSEFTAQSTHADLTKMTSADMEEVLQKLPLLAALESVQLAPGTENSGLKLEEVKQLKDAAPNVRFSYTFTLYGQEVSTDDESMTFKNRRKYINNDTLSQLRMALDIMNNCTRVVLDNTACSNDAMAQLREDYRDKTKIVWRVYYGEGGTSLTDVEVLRVVYGLYDDNCGSLKYLENVKYMDLGHNEFLDYCDFVSNMTELEVAIISGAPIQSLEPFANCKKLKFLEMANCSYIPDLEPLRSCTELEMLNIGHTSISDLSPLDELKLTHLCSKVNKVSEEELNRFVELQPDCWTTYQGDVDYSTGWRYDEEGNKLEWYAKLADAFGYPNPNNNTGWYLD